MAHWIIFTRLSMLSICIRCERLASHVAAATVVDDERLDVDEAGAVTAETLERLRARERQPLYRPGRGSRAITCSHAHGHHCRVTPASATAA